MPGLLTWSAPSIKSILMAINSTVHVLQANQVEFRTRTTIIPPVVHLIVSVVELCA